jgi:hypothetical protein
MTLKYRQSSSSRSRVQSLIRRVQSIKNKQKGKKERIIGTKHYRQRLLERIHQRNTNTNLVKDEDAIDLNKRRITRKSSKADSSKAKSMIQSKGLDKVSRESLPQLPTVLDKEKYLKPIIKTENIDIPEMELDLSNNALPIVSFPTLTTTTSSNGTTKDKDTYTIAIPSYNRPELIQAKTLALLHRHGIPASKITIFVANKEQHDLYKTKIPADMYGNIVVGVLGLKNQRNFIMEYYPEGARIVQMDDDLDKIMELVPRITGRRSTRRSSKSTRRMRMIEDLDGFITRAFEICKEKRIFLWGDYPLANARFMSPKMTTDLRFIVGPFWGIINRHRPDLQITIDEKENAERTLKHYTIDGAVLRFNNVGIETRYYKNKGGMQDEGKNRKEEALKSVQYLHAKYPKLTKIYLGKKSGVPEIRLHSHTH